MVNKLLDQPYWSSEEIEKVVLDFLSLTGLKEISYVSNFEYTSDEENDMLCMILFSMIIPFYTITLKFEPQIVDMHIDELKKEEREFINNKGLYPFSKTMLIKDLIPHSFDRCEMIKDTMLHSLRSKEDAHFSKENDLSKIWAAILAKERVD